MVEGWRVGRSHRDAPEIDGLMFVEGVGNVGEIIRARVTGAEEYDLFGVEAGRTAKPKRQMKQLRMAAPAAPK